MAKRKQIWLSNPTIIFSLVAGIGVLLTGIVKFANFITVTDRVAVAEDKIETIEDYIQKQQMANELMQQMIQQKDDVIYSPDGKYYFDKQTQKWIPVKGGK